MNKNFWGRNDWSNLISSKVYVQGGATYTSQVFPAVTLDPLSSPEVPPDHPAAPECFDAPPAFGSTVNCGVEFTGGLAKGGSESIQSLATSNETECERLYNYGIGAYEVEKYRQAYDTLRAYVEQCYMTTGLFYLGVFSDIGASAQYMDPAQFHPDNMVAAREWFKRVLYYRPDTNYYCADVSAMFLTFIYWEGRGRDVNANLAVLKYLVDSNRCPGIIPEIFGEDTWKKSRENQYNRWRDTVTDSIATPLDTTLPSLEEIGMGILRGKPASVHHETDVVLKRLVSVKASPNPFVNDVALKIDLAASAMLRVDVYDQLGRSMYGEGQGYKPAGEHEVIIGTAGWSPGAYYARASTTNGEVQTLKLIKE